MVAAGRSFLVRNACFATEAHRAWGGRPDRDGMEAVTNPSQNMSNSPVEVLEAHHPIRVDEYGFVPDSCGPGRFRGGLGLLGLVGDRLLPGVD